MAAKKKAKDKPTISKKNLAKKMRPTKNLAKKKRIVKKKSATKKPFQRKVPARTKAVGKKAIGAKTASALKTTVRKKSQSVKTVEFQPERLGARSGLHSGDLQGLSNVEGANSESVGELVEEGNAFEADIVMGVEDAGNADKEVRTHEVPQDDVPEEYRDDKEK